MTDPTTDKIMAAGGWFGPSPLSSSEPVWQDELARAEARLAEAEALLRKVLHHQPPAPNPPARYLIEIAAFLAGDPDA